MTIANALALARRYAGGGETRPVGDDLSGVGRRLAGHDLAPVDQRWDDVFHAGDRASSDLRLLGNAIGVRDFDTRTRDTAGLGPLFAVGPEMAGVRAFPAMTPRPGAMWRQGPWEMDRKAFQSAMDEMPTGVRPYTWADPAPIGGDLTRQELFPLRYGRAREGLNELPTYHSVWEHGSDPRRPDPTQVEDAIGKTLSGWDKLGLNSTKDYYQSAIDAARAAGDNRKAAELYEKMMAGGASGRLESTKQALGSMNARNRALVEVENAQRDARVARMAEEDLFTGPVHERAALAQRYGHKYNVDKMTDADISSAWETELDGLRSEVASARDAAMKAIYGKNAKSSQPDWGNRVGRLIPIGVGGYYGGRTIADALPSSDSFHQWLGDKIYSHDPKMQAPLSYPAPIPRFED